MDLRQPVIVLGRLRSFYFGSPGGLGSNANSGLRRRGLSETLRGVPRPAGKPRTVARVLAENSSRAHPSNTGFRIDDGNCIPHKTRGAGSRSELFGNAGRGTSASPQQFLRGSNTPHVSSRKRYLGWLESLAAEHAIPNRGAGRPHHEAGSPPQIKMGARLSG